MKLKSFLKLVELPTKAASVFPFLVGTLYALYRFGELKVLQLILMLIAMLCLDMATTALNNYMDYKKAIKRHGFNYEQHNAMVSHDLDETKVKRLIGLMIVLAGVLGLWLFALTDLVVLVLGMVSFASAAAYSWGPVPISRTPLGELVSGVIMGGVITFISCYIHVFDRGIIDLAMTGYRLTLEFDLKEILGAALLALPLIAGISNIMLANNTCDMGDDFENRRFTLPLVIGKTRALKLFGSLYVMGYLSVVAGAALGYLPAASLLMLVTVPKVRKNVERFRHIQSKAETFILSVKNFMIMSAAYVLSLGLGVLARQLFF